MFSPDVLKLDAKKEVDRIINTLQKMLLDFKKRGVVVALSGGVDSSVTAALCVQALGKNRVLGLLMPEKESSKDTLRLSKIAVHHLGIDTVHEDITPILESIGCYRRRDEAIQTVIPEYNATYKAKIVLPSLIDSERMRLFSVVVQSPDGTELKARLNQKSYLGIVAATNFKQRVRKMIEYYHADRLNYAVTGTPNRLEYDQGFFVKLGDGAADIKPIVHLYKTQVYQLASFLNIPIEIRSRPPTTDTYSMSQSQEEFYFSLPYDKMDLCLYAKNHDIHPDEVADILDLTSEQVSRIYNDIDQKRRTTRYLHLKPLLIVDVPEIK